MFASRRENLVRCRDPLGTKQANKRNREIRKSHSSSKKKYALKHEIIVTLLPRAFSKLTKAYAYIDKKIVGLSLEQRMKKKAEQFISLFKKTLEGEIHPFEIKNLSATMTHWLKNKNCPSSFSVEKSCMLQDPNQENRIIRCK